MGLPAASQDAFYVLATDNGTSALDLSQLMASSSSIHQDLGPGSNNGMFIDMPLQVGAGALNNLDGANPSTQIHLLAASAARDSLYMQQQAMPGALGSGGQLDAWGTPGLLSLQDQHLGGGNGLMGLRQGGLVQDDLQTTLLLQQLQQLQLHQQQQQQQQAVAAAAAALQQQQAQHLAEQQLLAQLTAASQMQQLQPFQLQSSLQVQRLMQSMAQSRRGGARMAVGSRNVPIMAAQRPMPQAAANGRMHGMQMGGKPAGAAIKAQPPSWAGADWNPRAQAQATPTSGTGVFLPNMPAPKESSKPRTSDAASVATDARAAQRAHTHAQAQQHAHASPSSSHSAGSQGEPKSMASEPPMLGTNLDSNFSTITSQLSAFYEDP